MSEQAPVTEAEWVEITSGDAVLRGHRWFGDPLTVLLLHEPGEEYDLDRWRPLIPYLIGNKATVLAMDLRGHGASDGEWDAAKAVDDILAMIAFARDVAQAVVLCAAGESALHSVRAAESAGVDGVILLSPAATDGDPPRGAGEAKLIVAGSQTDGGKEAAVRFRSAAIGPAMSVILPTAAQGTGLLTSENAITCRGHIIRFLNERRHEAMRKIGAQPKDEFRERFERLKRGAPQ
jgi:pimeloyl-ACP methyl ester carboxylesterase